MQGNVKDGLGSNIPRRCMRVHGEVRCVHGEVRWV